MPTKSKVYFNLIFTAFSLVSLALTVTQMVADVWDETNAIQLLLSDPINSKGYLSASAILWIHQIPLDIYRPLSGSLFIILGKLAIGSNIDPWVLLRIFNNLLLIASVYLASLTLLNFYRIDLFRTILFAFILLFSSSVLITSTWFANIFDATCLFFLAVGFYSLHKKWCVLASVSLAASVFCKESYVLFLPLLCLYWVEADQSTKRAAVIPALSIFVASVIYWVVRGQLIAFGTEADVHKFLMKDYLNSLHSFLSGFVLQNSRFSQGDLIGLSGMLVLAYSIFTIKHRLIQLTIISTLFFASVVYWGMFSFQGEILISWQHFVGRLYLIPFFIFVFLFVRESKLIALLPVVLLSFYGLVGTFAAHLEFQRAYQRLYNLASESNLPLIIDFPEKPLEDAVRGISVGDFPDAPIRMDPLNGHLESKN